MELGSFLGNNSFQNIVLNRLASKSFMSNIYSQLDSTGEFQALQLIVLAVFSAMD